MASLDFYALRDDMRALLEFLFGETDLRVFESYSEYDAELREFRSTDELTRTFDLGSDSHGDGTAVLLQMWSPSVMQRIDIERIELKVPGHTFRHRVAGVGLLQLYFGGRHQRVITDSHFGHWNEAGARQRAAGDPDTVDWQALTRLSGRIQRHIRNRMAVGKLRARPILPAALTALRSGFMLRYHSEDVSGDAPEIQLVRPQAA
jgi:hypothetical protein